MRLVPALAFATCLLSLTARADERRPLKPMVVDDASATGPSYLQLGVNSSAADQVTFDDSQGASTDVLVSTNQTLAGGGCHFFWVAAGVKIPNSTDDVFVQMGYALCGGAPYPFIFTSGSTIPTSNQWLNLTQYSLKNGEDYTFAFSTNGVANGDGTYDYEFTMQPRHGKVVVLATIPFESPDTAAPYLLSEIAGSTNACADSLDIEYGPDRDALMALKNGRWQTIKHVDASYWYGPCADSNVEPYGTESFWTVVGGRTKQTTPVNAQVW